MVTMRLLIGGVVAGVIFFVSDLASHLVFGGRMTADLAAAGLAEPAMTPAMIATGIAMNLVFGIALIWLYAAIRPRFGPGMRTATYAGIFFWLIASLMSVGWVFMGIMSLSTYAILLLWYLPFTLIAAWAGGRLYREGAPTPAGAVA
jgi:hypothetical protein